MWMNNIYIYSNNDHLPVSLPLTCWINSNATPTPSFQPIRLLDSGCWYKFTYLMKNSTDQDQLASKEKPTDLDLHCLKRQDISGVSRTRVNPSISTDQYRDTCANSVAPDEMARSHQDLHCLPFYWLLTKLLFATVVMSKFRGGWAHFRNSGLKGLSRFYYWVYIKVYIKTTISSYGEKYTTQPLYNMVCYHTILDITLFKDGPKNV